MNKIQKTIDTQDAQFDEKFPTLEQQTNYDTFTDHKPEVKTFIQSSRTALIEAIVEMGEDLKSQTIRVEELNAINVFLEPLKEVIDKEQ